MRQQPDAQRQQIAAAVVGIVALLENTDDVVGGEKFQIRTKRPDVRMWNKIEIEIGDVIPGEEVARNFRPSFQVVGEGSINRTAQRMSRVGLYGTETHQYIRRGLEMAGRVTRVLIGQCFN